MPNGASAQSSSCSLDSIPIVAVGAERDALLLSSNHSYGTFFFQTQGVRNESAAMHATTVNRLL